MTFVDVFGSVVEAGTLIEVEITGFTNPSSETILNVFYEVIHTSTEVSPVNYQIDKFQNLGTLSGVSTSTRSSLSDLVSSFSNTKILITDSSKRSTTDCRIKASDLFSTNMAQTAPYTGIVIVEDSNHKFEAIGDACAGRNTWQVSAYALNAAGIRLNSLYTVASINFNGLIQVSINAAYDAGASTNNAVYVQVTDAANPHSTNVFCFMVKVSSTDDDFCRSICQE